MNQFIRLAQAPAIAVVFASVWFSGCATPESGGRATVLSLPYGQFDQTFGSGWRPIFDRREYGKAAALIEDYLRSHHELTVGQQKFLHLHAAMLLALEGRNFRAQLSPTQVYRQALRYLWQLLRGHVLVGSSLSRCHLPAGCLATASRGSGKVSKGVRLLGHRSDDLPTTILYLG